MLFRRYALICGMGKNYLPISEVRWPLHYQCGPVWIAGPVPTLEGFCVWDLYILLSDFSWTAGTASPAWHCLSSQRSLPAFKEGQLFSLTAVLLRAT